MDYKQKAALLKKAGFVDYDLRRELNQQQKSAITRIWKSNSAVITHKDNFVSRTVNKAAADKMRRDGYTVNKKGRVFVQKEGYETVSIKSAKKGRAVDVKITRRIGNKKSVTKVYSQFELLKALETFDDKKLKRGQLVTVRIGDHAAFKTAYNGSAQLLAYVNNTFQPKDPGTDKDYLISQMSIVTIEGNRPHAPGRVPKKKRGQRGKR